MSKTTQLGLRLEKELIDKIEFLAENEGLDRNLWIKRALASFVMDEEDGMADKAIEDYINLRIDKKTFLEFTDYEKIPEDIKKAREQKLKQILEENSNGKNIHK